MVNGCFAEEVCSAYLPTQKAPLTLFTEHWPPYQRELDDKSFEGITTDKIKFVLDKANWPYEIKVLPWARAVYQVEHVNDSFLFSTARFPERENKFQWVVPLTKVTSKLIRFNNDSHISVNRLTDIKDYTIALKRGEASSTLITDNKLIDESQIIWVTDSSQALKLLSVGRVDMYPATVDGFEEAVKASDFTNTDFSYVYNFKELDVDLYLTTSLKTSPQFTNQIRDLFTCFLSHYPLVKNEPLMAR